MKKKPAVKNITNLFLIAVAIIIVVWGGKFIMGFIQENKVLKQIITRLEADSRIAEVLVSGVTYDENSGKYITTIKFLEYDSQGKPLSPRYFTFQGNVIQFQSLVIRFDDLYIKQADALRGKSAYLFWKIFMLDGNRTQEYEITPLNQIPQGYKLKDGGNEFETELWSKFWEYALNPQKADRMGVKNAQIEAPGTMFIPGMVYTIKIEHDGGMRIDAVPIPEVLKGETIPR